MSEMASSSPACHFNGSVFPKLTLGVRGLKHQKLVSGLCPAASIQILQEVLHSCLAMPGSYPT